MNINNNNASKSRMEQIQEEFKMTDSEVNEIFKFISSLKEDMTVLEAMEELIESDNLNVRQKVAFSHVLGIFRSEGDTFIWPKKNKILKEKLSKCQLFTALATKNYLNDLRNNDGDIQIQVSIARELNLPFFIIIDRRLSQSEIDEIRKYFSKDKVVKELMVDIGSENSAKIVSSEIRQMMKCMYPCEGQTIEIVTQDSDEKD